MTFLLIATVTSMLLAAIMSAIAWRIAGDERRRSEARVAALAAEIHDDDVDGVGRVLLDPPIRVPMDPDYGSLFVAPQPRQRARPFAILGGGALMFGAAVALAVVSSGRFSRLTPSVATAAAAPTVRPLELVALGTERTGDQLTVRGVVRNPATGAGVDRLTAVVLVFTPGGEYLATGRADIEASPLRPGGESAFAVTVPRAADVARYRVSFTTEDHIVPHLDRRHEG